MRFFKDRPALALFFLAPIFGELFSGSSPLNEFLFPFTFLGLALLYGSGALLIREWVVRWQKGWPSLLLLGFAYGVYEEGIVVRSFFNPQWMDLGILGEYGRAGGVNWVWAFHLTVFHGVVSVLSSIAFTEILYPHLRGQPWIRRRWHQWLLVLALLLWLPLGKLLTPYDAPNGWLFLTWLGIGFLVLLARIAPRWDPRPRHTSPPKPAVLFLWALAATFGHHVLIYVFAENAALPFPLTILQTALFDLFVLWMLLRWRDSRQPWDDRHRLALILGVQAFFLLFPLLIGPETPLMYCTNPVFFLLLVFVYVRVRRRLPDVRYSS